MILQRTALFSAKRKAKNLIRHKYYNWEIPHGKTAEHLGKKDCRNLHGNTLRVEKYPSSRKVEQKSSLTGMVLSLIPLTRRAQLREETSPLPILHAAARRNE